MSKTPARSRNGWKKDPRIDHVTYAGLPSSPYHHRVARICPKGAGALFTFAVKGGYDACVKLIDNVKLFSHVANLGDTRSLIIHSASTTHRQLTEEQQIKAAPGRTRARVDRDRTCRRHHRRPRSGTGGGNGLKWNKEGAAGIAAPTTRAFAARVMTNRCAVTAILPRHTPGAIVTARSPM